MNCSKCHREVHETKHTIDGAKPDFYGIYTTRAEKVGKSREGDDLHKGWVEPDEIICVGCHK